MKLKYGSSRFLLATAIISSSLVADNEAERGCGKSETFCTLTVTNVAKIGTLFVNNNETVGGNLRVQGSLTVNGPTFLTTLFINGLPFVPTDAFVQDGNSFGEPALLGTNDNFGLNIETHGNQRIQITNTGEVTIVAPDALAGVALTVNGNNNATAQTITAGTAQIALDIVNGNINLTNSTDATTGNITKAGNRFMHNYPGSGFNNTFLGIDAGNFTTLAGDTNTGIGMNSLINLINGNTNTAVGGFSLQSNTNGNLNTAIGAGSMQGTTVGDNNVAVGYIALSQTDGNENIGIGYQAATTLTTGDQNIIIGANAEPTVGTREHSILIGYSTRSDADDQIRIGFGFAGSSTYNNTFIDGIFGVTVAGASTVLIDSAGQLGTVPSSRRYKENITTLSPVQEKFMLLNPVAFTYKSDTHHKQQYGLIAEEVEALFPELVVYNKEGKAETVQYHLLYAFFIKMIQDLQHRIEQLEAKQNN